MKKIFIAMLSLGLVATLTACGGGEQGENANTGETTPEAQGVDGGYHQVTEDEAREIALGVAPGEVTNVGEEMIEDLLAHVVTVETDSGIVKVQVAVATGDVLGVVVE